MSVVAHLKELVDSLSTLTVQHLRLARLELRADARYIGVRVGVIAALAPLILVGYGFLCLALALALQRMLPTDLAFLTVGLLNLILGVVGIAVVARQLQGHRVLDATVTELETTSSLVLRREERR
jgi:Putative Actinobacterial Holin-X, holin superfamily III